MKCFYHRDVDAVGCCRACGKGVCGGCAVDVGGGLACKDSCQGLVREMNQLLRRNIRLSPASEQMLVRQPRAVLVAGIFSAAMGGLFIVAGQGLGLGGAYRLSMCGIGVLIVIMGVWRASVGWRLAKVGREQ